MSRQASTRRRLRTNNLVCTMSWNPFVEDDPRVAGRFFVAFAEADPQCGTEDERDQVLSFVAPHPGDAVVGTRRHVTTILNGVARAAWRKPRRPTDVPHGEIGHGGEPGPTAAPPSW